MSHDWYESDKRLYDVAHAAIAKFAKNHVSEQLCCFFFDCDEPRYGRIAISLDRPSISLQVRCYPHLIQNSGDFQFPEFMKVAFPSWRKLADTGDYPSGTENDDDYLESNARLVDVACRGKARC